MMKQRVTLAVIGLVGAITVVLGFATSVAGAECTTSFLRGFGGEPYGRLSNPRDVAIDSKGNTWVLDSGHSRIQEFNSSGEFVTQFEVKETMKGVAVDSENHIWTVAEHKVNEFKATGELILSFGEEGFGVGKLNAARDLAFDPTGNIWVVEASGISASRVQKFNTKGEYLTGFGKEGTENGQFKSPESIAVDPEGNILVADTGNNRYQEFNPAGEFVRKVGTEGTGNGQFKSPAGIAVDSEGKVWVADTGNNRIERFSAKGAYLSQFGVKGPNDGQFKEPRGIAVFGSNIWVADSGNNRVQEFNCL